MHVLSLRHDSNGQGKAEWRATLGLQTQVWEGCSVKRSQEAAARYRGTWPGIKDLQEESRVCSDENCPLTVRIGPLRSAWISPAEEGEPFLSRHGTALRSRLPAGVLLSDSLSGYDVVYDPWAAVWEVIEGRVRVVEGWRVVLLLDVVW